MNRPESCLERPCSCFTSSAKRGRSLQSITRPFRLFTSFLISAPTRTGDCKKNWSVQLRATRKASVLSSSVLPLASLRLRPLAEDGAEPFLRAPAFAFGLGAGAGSFADPRLWPTCASSACASGTATADLLTEEQSAESAAWPCTLAVTLALTVLVSRAV